jgi:hypothetical protein
MRTSRVLQRASVVLAFALAACVIPIGTPITPSDGGVDGSIVTPGGDSGPGVLDATTGLDGATVQGTWTLATSNLTGLSSGCGNLGFVSAKPDEDAVIVAIGAQGLFASLHGSTQWTPLGAATDGGLDQAGGELFANNTSQLVYDPAHPTTYWQAGNHGPCAYTTADDGNSFTQLGSALGCDSISIDFSDPARKTILAGGHESSSVFRSTDGGMTWTDVGPNVPAAAGYTGWVLLESPLVHLVGSYSGTNDGIFRTIDAGKTWSQVYSGGIRSPALVTSDAMYWVLNGENADSHGVVKSTDQGVTWAKLPGSESIITTETGVLALPGGLLATAGPTGLLVSPDKGTTWSRVGPDFPFTPAGMTYSTFRNQFYIWQWQCAAGTNPIPADDIQSLTVSFH